MEGAPWGKTSGAGPTDPSTLFLESDFTFDGLEAQNPIEFSDRLGFSSVLDEVPLQNRPLRGRGHSAVVSLQ